MNRVASKPTSGIAADLLPPVERGVELPIVEWGNMALRAGRVGTNYPHMAWLQRFDEQLTVAELQAEARRLGTNPYGFGRRLIASRLPAGRMRWRQCANIPTVELDEQAVSDWEAWVDAKLGRRLDPETGNGWAYLACHTDGEGTVVLILMHHLFGTARGLNDALFETRPHDPLTGSTGYTFTARHDYTLKAEVRGIFERVRLGFVGIGVLLSAIPGAIRSLLSRDRSEDPIDLRPPRGLDPTRHALSANRVHARYVTTPERFEAIAAEHGGSANTLVTAISANLLRRARIARGGPIDRRIQLLLPMDLPDEEKRAKLERVGKDPGAEDLLITAVVVMEGGEPVHGDLTQLRARTKRGYIKAGEDSAGVRGANDFARLLPEALTYRFAERAAVGFDGCVSNVGELPHRLWELGDRRAVHAEMIGFPIGNELMSAILRGPETVTLTFTTDPARMGVDTNLRGWLEEELAAWGLD
ncbi:MAG: hypothetical protein QM648_00230 [Solirubrobacterales bacterium]